ncbi:regulatory protein MerR [Granulicella mallensis MP5ACTX8]|uniref:Regulatory protein MerR n=2 Tax=Granulicella mallensis TaxID=940614 RepID=G8P1H1_GRAMM|nr:regulatory protein MerR [Granulicella mallensis MP5ACTX8]
MNQREYHRKDWFYGNLHPILQTPLLVALPHGRIDSADVDSMGSHQPIRKIVAPEIPDKLYFRIGDVARLCEVPAYVLRFWETEFPQLKPNKGGTGQRLYRKRDVEMALRIKSLLYDQGYTIPGARQVFKTETKPKETPAMAAEAAMLQAVPQPPVAEAAASASLSMPSLAQLVSLRDEMHSLLDILSAPVAVSDPASSPTEKREESKVQAMRPRLVLEPKPEPRPLHVISERPKLRLEQRGLFGEESPEPTDLSE